MLIPQFSQLATFTKDFTEYIIYKLEKNTISELGCKFLSKAHWPSIRSINLGSNSFGDKGAQHLSNANWL